MNLTNVERFCKWHKFAWFIYIFDISPTLYIESLIVFVKPVISYFYAQVSTIDICILSEKKNTLSPSHRPYHSHPVTIFSTSLRENPLHNYLCHTIDNQSRGHRCPSSISKDITRSLSSIHSLGHAVKSSAVCMVIELFVIDEDKLIDIPHQSGVEGGRRKTLLIVHHQIFV